MGDMSLFTYKQILGSVQAKGIDASLEPITQLLGELGNPESSFKAIQIVGTNGKTSTARYAAAILAGEGLKVGIYLSPMFMDYLDQVEVEGKPIEEVELSVAVRDAWQASENLNARREAQGKATWDFTEFELLTAAAALVFCHRGVDVAVLEAGMGGAWDATSAVGSIQTVGITGIGLDHTRMLGTTLSQIARNKAAVIKTGRRCVLGAGTQTDPDVAAVFADRCADQQMVPLVVGEEGSKKRADVRYAICDVPHGIDDMLSMSIRMGQRDYEGLCATKPRYQAQNIACAAAIAQTFLQRPLNEEVLRDSIHACRTPGRFDLLQRNPLVLVDACHNPQSVSAFLDAWRSISASVREESRCGDVALLCAIFADKDVERMVSMLAEEFSCVVVTQTKSPRAMPAGELSKVFEVHGVRPEALFANVGDAVSYLAGRPFVACGSITTAGEVAGLCSQKGSIPTPFS